MPAKHRPVRAKMFDISPAGINLRCDAKTAAALPFKPPGKEFPKGSEVVARLVIHIDPQPLEINARCRCCYARLYKANEVALGLQLPKRPRVAAANWTNFRSRHGTGLALLLLSRSVLH